MSETVSFATQHSLIPSVCDSTSMSVTVPLVRVGHSPILDHGRVVVRAVHRADRHQHVRVACTVGRYILCGRYGSQYLGICAIFNLVLKKWSKNIAHKSCRSWWSESIATQSRLFGRSRETTPKQYRIFSYLYRICAQFLSKINWVCARPPSGCPAPFTFQILVNNGSHHPDSRRPPSSSPACPPPPRSRCLAGIRKDFSQLSIRITILPCSS